MFGDGVGLQKLERQPTRVGVLDTVMSIVFEPGQQLQHRRLDTFAMRERHAGRLASLGHRQQSRLQLGQTLFADSHQRHDRTAERLAQRRGVDLDAALARDVHHVERDQDGHAHLQQLHGQIEMTLQIAGIEHVDDEISLAPEQIVARDHLVERAGVERVDPRQVDHPHLASVELQ